jgi:hypothetical protein
MSSLFWLVKIQLEKLPFRLKDIEHKDNIPYIDFQEKDFN